MTTMNPAIGKNTTISIKSGDTDYIQDACVREISELSHTADTVDVTCYGSSNVRKKIKTLIDLGSMTVGINYNGQTMGTSLNSALESPESCDVEIRQSISFRKNYAEIPSFATIYPTGKVNQSDEIILSDGSVRTAVSVEWAVDGGGVFSHSVVKV